MCAARIPLGQFVLLEPVIRGGMAVVWRAEHAQQGIPVAVKVVESKHGKSPLYRRFFRNEVRAVAGLDHPHVVVVYDYGEIPGAAAVRAPKYLSEGCPYLVMEWASGGNLASKPPASWHELRDTLLVLLDALAHAHARGVIHRDIKPGNVLRCEADDARPGLKLADFGIARPPDQLVEQPLTTGTPAYMAPEQARGLWREQGPWTDLYSLGRVAYRFVTGSLPPPDEREARGWGGSEPPVPPLAPLYPIPDDFEPWLHLLLADRPADRFRRAADAAWELSRVGPPTLPPTDPGTGVPLVELPTVADPTPVLISLTLVDFEDGQVGTSVHDEPTRPQNDAAPQPQGLPRSLTRTAQSTDEHPPVVPVLPTDWRRPEAPTQRTHLFGAGLGLFGLRPIPMVDRDAERDTLWSELLTTHDEGWARAVVLQGAAGCGKSRLARWLCERAHEVGAATALDARHAPMPGPADGLGPMVARFLRCVSASREEVLERVEAILEQQGETDLHDERLSLAQVIRPVGHSEIGPTVRFRDAAERWAVLTRLLERLSRERPVIVWLDDVQWGFDGMGFVSHVLKMQAHRPTSVLFLLTVRTEALVERELEAERLTGLLAQERVSAMDIGPLPLADRRELVSELLGLEGPLAARVEERTAGNPLFAVALVSDWVARGLLEPTETGFRLVEGAIPELPSDLQEVWGVRVDRVLVDRPERDGLALELAATLGQAVAWDEWKDACHLRGIEASLDLVEELLHERLASSDRGPLGGWSFVHGMIRETLEERARAAGRLADHHRACAEMLRARVGAGMAERLGLHLLRAGDHAAALPLLLEGARERTRGGDYRIAGSLLTARDRSMDRLALPDGDPRRAEAWGARVIIERRSGRLPLASTLADRAIRDARRFDLKLPLCEALQEAGIAAFYRGDTDGALEHFEQALAAAEDIGDRDRQGAARQGMADALWPRGELARADGLFRGALEDRRAVGNPAGIAACLQGIGSVALVDNRLDEAAPSLEQAVLAFDAAGDRWGSANASTALADVFRLRGDHLRAETLYRRTIRRFERLGAGQSVYPRQNLGVLYLQLGRFRDARAELEVAREQMRARDLRISLGLVETGLVACAAGLDDWPSFEVSLKRATELLEETALVDQDVAIAAEAGAGAVLEAEEPSNRRRARPLLEVALNQWRALGRTEEAARVAQRLAALPE